MLITVKGKPVRNFFFFKQKTAYESGLGIPAEPLFRSAVGFYVAKYVNKKSDMDLAAKGLGAKEWNNSLKTKLSLLPKKLSRIRMSRNSFLGSSDSLVLDRKSGV